MILFSEILAGKVRHAFSPHENSRYLFQVCHISLLKLLKSPQNQEVSSKFLRDFLKKLMIFNIIFSPQMVTVVLQSLFRNDF